MTTWDQIQKEERGKQIVLKEDLIRISDIQEYILKSLNPTKNSPTILSHIFCQEKFWFDHKSEFKTCVDFDNSLSDISQSIDGTQLHNFKFILIRQRQFFLFS